MSTSVPTHTTPLTVGQPLPLISFKAAGLSGMDTFLLKDFLKGRVVMFGLPGAFTPLCSSKQVPGFLKHTEVFRAKGIERIICVCVNDAFVVGEWKKSFGLPLSLSLEDFFVFLADGNGEFTQKAGFALDMTAHGLGIRSKRYGLVAQDGVIEALYVEDDAGSCTISQAETLLKTL